MWEKIKIWLTDELSKFKDDIPSIFCYLVGTIILFGKDGIFFTYIGLVFWGIGAMIWLINIYLKYKKHLVKKFLFWFVGMLCVPISQLLTNLGIVSRLGFPASDFPNTQILLRTLLYFPMWCVIFLSFIVVFLLLRISLEKIFEVIKIEIKPFIEIKYQTKWVINTFHLLGVLMIYAIAVSSLKLFESNHNFILIVAENIDYAYMKGYPNVPHDKKILIHAGGFFSEVREIGGNKFIISTPIN